MTDIYSIEQIRRLESMAVDELKINESTLMERAGRGAFSVLKARWPKAQRVVVFCGTGNNAGDGYVLAQVAAKEGLEVSVRHLGELAQLKGAALAAANACLAADVEVLPFTPGELYDTDVMVDALLGIGITGPVREAYQQVIRVINDHSASVLSIDVPSGLDADRGAPLNEAVKADVTITFIGLKQGLLTGPALNYCGEVVLHDLDLPTTHFAKINPSAHVLAWKSLKTFLPTRAPDTHKHNYGHVLVMGGDIGMGGAVTLAATAAYRVGAGLVTVATHSEHSSLVTGYAPEIMCRPVIKPKDLNGLLEQASVVVLGPGLGQTKWGQALFEVAVECSAVKVVDADALNYLSTVSMRREDWILTPHPGEAARLLGTDTKQVQQDRYTAIAELQQRYGGVVVLKGAGSLVRGTLFPLGVCTYGNPGMATAGMGDILSGMIGGLLAQGLHLEQGAHLGVCLHAKAGDTCARHQGSRGLMATDLLPIIQRLINE